MEAKAERSTTIALEPQSWTSGHFCGDISTLNRLAEEEHKPSTQVCVPTAHEDDIATTTADGKRAYCQCVLVRQCLELLRIMQHLGDDAAPVLARLRIQAPSWVFCKERSPDWSDTVRDMWESMPRPVGIALSWDLLRDIRNLCDRLTPTQATQAKTAARDLRRMMSVEKDEHAKQDGKRENDESEDEDAQSETSETGS